MAEIFVWSWITVAMTVSLIRIAIMPKDSVMFKWSIGNFGGFMLFLAFSTLVWPIMAVGIVKKIAMTKKDGNL